MNGRNRAFGTVIFFGLAVTFLACVVHLLALRLSRGDTFPPYSTYRTDPLGCKALYQAIKRMPGYTCVRNISATQPLPDGANHALFIQGISRNVYLNDNDRRQLESFVSTGGLLILTYAASDTPKATQPPICPHSDCEPSPEDKSGGDSSSTKNNKTTDPDTPVRECGSRGKKHYLAPLASLENHFGFKLDYRPGEKNHSEAHCMIDNKQLPPVLPWHTKLVFETSNDKWTSYYSVENKPVLMMRPYGQGSIIVIAETFLLSNEAMRHKRQSGLLAWMLGTARKVIFDETHLGTVQSPGIASLVGRYQLWGAVGALALLALLFVWQASTSLLPKNDHTPVANTMHKGRDSTAALKNLLKQNIDPKNLLDECFREWKETSGHTHDFRQKAAAIHKVLQTEKNKKGRDQNLPGCYLKLCNIIAERKTPRDS